jgi:SAM-dependent methyltransferase
MSWTQRERAKIIADCYSRWEVRGKKVLDVGCGNGVVSQVLQKKLELGLCGTDIIDYRKVKISFKQMCEADRLPFEDLSFDYVIFNDVLHHSMDTASLILEGRRVGHAVLVFEDMPGFLLNIIDIVFNFFYSSKMSCPLNFKTEGEWCSFFEELGLSYETGKVFYPFWYPVRHAAFKLI